MMLVMRDVNFDNKVKRNTIDLSHASYPNVVPNYDEIFPDHTKAIACEEYLLHKGSREGNQLIVSLAFIWFHSCCCFHSIGWGYGAYMFMFLWFYMCRKLFLIFF